MAEMSKEEAEFYKGAYMAMMTKDYAKAAELCQKGADIGGAESQYMLGDFYLKGLGVPKDKDKAIELFRKAAEQGQEDAKSKLKELGLESVSPSSAPSSSPSRSSSSDTPTDDKKAKDEKKNMIAGACAIAGAIIAILPGFGILRLIIGFVIGSCVGMWIIAPLLCKFTKFFVVLLIVGAVGVGGYFTVSKFAPDLLSSIKNKTVTTVAAAEIKTVTVKTEALNLRAEASTSSEILKKLKKGDVLKVIGETVNGWLPVEHEGTKGHVSTDMVE